MTLPCIFIYFISNFNFNLPTMYIASKNSWSEVAWNNKKNFILHVLTHQSQKQQTKSCRVLPVVAVSFPKLELVVKGGQNIVADENQNWRSSKMHFLEPTTITSPFETESQLNRNHVVDYNTLSKLLQENVYCKSCVNKFIWKYCKQSLSIFLTSYFKSNRKQKLSIEQQYEAFLSTMLSTMNQPLIWF